MSPTKICACESPPIIDLSSSWDGNDDELIRESLRSTLSQFGWCHVSIDGSKLPVAFRKSNFLKLFESVELQTLLENRGVRYRGRSAESGSSNPEQAEPKQSLEVQRCWTGYCSSSSLHQYMNVLHSIAVAINKLLLLPEDVFLQQAACTGDGCKTYKCNNDLLRIFRYDPAYPELGSSAHTDWGSWTVVWQDETTDGGLQTFCTAHRQFVNVKLPQPMRNDKAYFVVHVGDLTSLALAHATQRGSATSVSFPSPKHRVVCPLGEPRVSLVYFAYPPPSTTLADVEKAMENHTILEDSQVCYDSYYLLQNQAPGGPPEDPEAVYRRIRYMPVSEVFQEKWNQVQRSSTQIVPLELRPS